MEVWNLQDQYLSMFTLTNGVQILVNQRGESPPRHLFKYGRKITFNIFSVKNAWLAQARDVTRIRNYVKMVQENLGIV